MLTLYVHQPKAAGSSLINKVLAKRVLSWVASLTRLPQHIQLTNYMALDLLKLAGIHYTYSSNDNYLCDCLSHISSPRSSGLRKAAACLVLPMATGMSLVLSLATLRYTCSLANTRACNLRVTFLLASLRGTDPSDQLRPSTLCGLALIKSHASKPC